MAIKPILFNTEMVRAILDGRKSCTRRVIKPQPDEKHTYPLGFVNDSTEKKEIGCFGFAANEYGGSIQYVKPPYRYAPGDILYVRESYSELSFGYVYKADGENIDHLGNVIKWHPSIHMPKDAARIWLKVTDVRVERLQEISEDGAVKEGIYVANCKDCNAPFGCDVCPDEGYNEIDEFVELWNSTIKKSDLDRYGWDANPYVFVIEFERCEKPEYA